MRTIGSCEATIRLPELLRQLEQGEQFTITRRVGHRMLALSRRAGDGLGRRLGLPALRGGNRAGSQDH